MLWKLRACAAARCSTETWCETDCYLRLTKSRARNRQPKRFPRALPELQTVHLQTSILRYVTGWPHVNGQAENRGSSRPSLTSPDLTFPCLPFPYDRASAAMQC